MGCYDPLDHTSGAAQQKLRTIETFKDVIIPASHRPVDANEPIDSPAERSMSIGQCRAVPLANNLDLEVELLDPSIAAETIAETQARFESLFFSNVDYATLDIPRIRQQQTSFWPFEESDVIEFTPATNRLIRTPVMTRIFHSRSRIRCYGTRGWKSMPIQFASRSTKRK